MCEERVTDPQSSVRPVESIPSGKGKVNDSPASFNESGLEVTEMDTPTQVAARCAAASSCEKLILIYEAGQESNSAISNRSTKDS